MATTAPPILATSPAADRPRSQQPESAPTRDDVLAAALRDRLAHDDRTAELELSIELDGAVAHVRGAVPRQEDVRLLRRLLRDVGGLRAVWDLVSVGGRELAVIDIGCGDAKQVHEAVGIDVAGGADVDIVADLEHGLPLADSCIDHVFAVHILEHIRDLPALMDELHRVVRPGGVLHAMTPSWRHVNAVADPTHCRFIAPETFGYFSDRRRRLPWEPLMVTEDDVNVYADLTPMKSGARPDPRAVARWFGDH